MSLNIFNDYFKLLKTRTGFVNPEPSLALLTEISRYFLTPVIQDRAQVLADLGNESLDNFLQSVSDEYLIRFEKIISDDLRALKESNSQFFFPWLTEGKLSKVFFRYPLKDSDFASHYDFQKLLRTVRTDFGFRGLLAQLPLPPAEARAIAAFLLHSVQQLALQIINHEYPATSRKGTVPESAEKTIKNLLTKLTTISSRLLPEPPIKSLSQAEAELRVAIARSEGRVALPLRSIPTAPLTETDLEKHYVGRPDEEANRLARQVRHADGTILVTGYRGVGKSSFVNRVIYHALQCQKDVPSDGWLIVPVTVNLAKVSGVQNILRLTLRAVRSALLDSDTSRPRRIPGFLKPVNLPLDNEKEIEPLKEAYTRATFRVTMSRSNQTENKFMLDGSLGLDIAKLTAPLGGLQLPGFMLKGSRSRTHTLNRNLSLLDYDENAAEDDLAQLIRALANPRPIFESGGSKVRIKLVFIFDELDKMNVEEGLRPMIEGLKNLFLQQYAIFILVTSKRFYYDLLKARAIEDSMLNSYFSAIVHVPLLTFDQARKMVGDWIDWPDGINEPLVNEGKLLDQLTRVLLYRSYGNPRDIIRELRQMQEWADTTERPYISDRLAKSQVVQIFAGIQECIEAAARPESTPTPSGADDNGGGVTLVSERLSGDETRLEQVRRGLYILTEALINRETLSLLPTDLTQLQADNFSLLSIPDVEQLARKLGFRLGLLHQSLPMEVFGSLNVSDPPKLFLDVDKSALKTTAEFYRLTGRQASQSEVQTVSATAPDKAVSELISDAETLASRLGWPERLSAIGIIKQLEPSKLTPALGDFLLKLSTEETDVLRRRIAAKQLTSEMLFRDANRDLSAMVVKESDEAMLSIYLPLLGRAADESEKKRATAAVLALLKPRVSTTGYGALATPRLAGTNAEVALTVLQAVATSDVVTEILEWLCSSNQTEQVQETALRTLSLICEKFQLDQAERIITNKKYLDYFAASRPAMWWTPALSAKLNSHLRNLLVVRPLYYADLLLQADYAGDSDALLAPLWHAAFEPTNPELAQFVFKRMATEESASVIKKLLSSLRQTPDFTLKILPYLLKSSEQPESRSSYSEEQRKLIEKYLAEIKIPIAIADPSTVLYDTTADKLLKTFRLPLSQTGLGSAVSLPSQRSPFSFISVGAALVTVLAGALFYKRDLPAAATLTQAFVIRLILFTADLSIVLGTVQIASMTPAGQKTDLETAGYSSEPFSPAGKISVSNMIYGSVYWIGIGFFYLYGKYVAPLTFWNQVILFLINLPAIAMVTATLRRRMTLLRNV